MSKDWYFWLIVKYTWSFLLSDLLGDLDEICHELVHWGDLFDMFLLQPLGDTDVLVVLTFESFKPAW